MRRLTIAAVTLAFLVACQPATTEFTEEQRAAVAQTVEQLADAFLEDFRTLDFDGAVAPWGSEIIWAENGVLASNSDLSPPRGVVSLPPLSG